jgi:SAM-dependent methyltransferase
VENVEVNYVLGHSAQELERLSAQARHFEPFTRQVFQTAGVIPGMRVLDVGSGVGDVAFLAADLVGDKGSVVGSDRVPVAIATARARAVGMGLRNVTFCEGDPGEMAFDQPFDAVVGRFILMHAADATAMLRRLAGHLRHRSLIVFIEPAWSYVRSQPLASLYERCCRWIVQTLRVAGVETDMGIKLYPTFVAAGLPTPSMQLCPRIAGPAASSDSLRLVADLVNSMQSEIMRSGLATAAEIDSETLADRLRAEATTVGSVIVEPGLVGAWTRV